MTPEAFQHFRTAQPDCALLVLSDTRSGTVLAADGALAYPQEYLDGISATARAALNAPGGERPWAVFVGPNGAQLFQRVPHLGDVALTCLIPPETDVDMLLQELSAFARTLDPWEAAA